MSKSMQLVAANKRSKSWRRKKKRFKVLSFSKRKYAYAKENSSSALQVDCTEEGRVNDFENLYKLWLSLFLFVFCFVFSLMCVMQQQKKNFAILLERI